MAASSSAKQQSEMLQKQLAQIEQMQRLEEAKEARKSKRKPLPKLRDDDVTAKKGRSDKVGSKAAGTDQADKLASAQEREMEARRQELQQLQEEMDDRRHRVQQE